MWTLEYRNIGVILQLWSNVVSKILENQTHILGNILICFAYPLCVETHSGSYCDEII